MVWLCSMAVDEKLSVAATRENSFSERSRLARTAIVAIGSCGRRICEKFIFCRYPVYDFKAHIFRNGI